MPVWAEAMFPGLTTEVGKTTFYDYDIDHPGARTVWSHTLDAIVPPIAAFASTSASIGWGLANEPGFYAANSSYTLANWTVHLKGEYSSLNALAAAWNLTTTPSSWESPVIAQGMGWATYV